MWRSSILLHGSRRWSQIGHWMLDRHYELTKPWMGHDGSLWPLFWGMFDGMDGLVETGSRFKLETGSLWKLADYWLASTRACRFWIYWILIAGDKLKLAVGLELSKRRVYPYSQQALEVRLVFVGLAACTCWQNMVRSLPSINLLSNCSKLLARSRYTNIAPCPINRRAGPTATCERTEELDLDRWGFTALFRKD